MDYHDPYAPDARRWKASSARRCTCASRPLKNAPLVAQLPTDVRFRITHVTDEYAYILFEGKEGYVYMADFVEMEYRKGSTEPYIAYVDEETPAYDTPCYGATVGALLQPYTPVTVDGFDGDHVTIVYQGQRLYVEAGELTRLSEDYALEPSAPAGRPGRRAAISPGVRRHHRRVRQGRRRGRTGLHGDYALVTDGLTAGYIPFKRLKSQPQVDAAMDMLGQLQERLEGQSAS